MRAHLWSLTALLVLHGCQTETKPASTAAAPTLTSAQRLPGCLYPDFASLSAVPEGLVNPAVQISLNAQGTPTAASVVATSGSNYIDVEWVRALLRCKYAPATSNGRPIDSELIVSPGWNPRGPQKGLARCIYPPYPSESRKRGEQGTVVVGFVVDPATRRAQSQVVTSSGHPRLDDAAKQYVDACLENERVRNDYPAGEPQRVQQVWQLKNP